MNFLVLTVIFFSKLNTFQIYITSILYVSRYLYYSNDHGMMLLHVFIILAHILVCLKIKMSQISLGDNLLIYYI